MDEDRTHEAPPGVGNRAEKNGDWEFGASVLGTYPPTPAESGVSGGYVPTPFVRRESFILFSREERAPFRERVP